MAALTVSTTIFFSTEPALAEDLVFRLINETSVTVTGFYISHSGTRKWEENLIAGDRLRPGSFFNIMIEDGRRTYSYDIRTKFQEGEALDDYDGDLCELEEFVLEE